MLEKNEKILIYIAIGIITVVFFIVIYNIWFPSKNNIKNLINIYTEENSYTDLKIKEYTKRLQSLLNISSFDELYGYINSEYLINNNLNDINSARDFFEKNFYIGNEIKINSISVISITDDIYTYRVEYLSNSLTRYVTIIETSVNDFTLDFDQLNINEFETVKSTNIDGIEYTVKTLSSTDDSLKLNININSKSDNIYKFNFNDIFSVQLKLMDGTYINLATVVAGDKNDYIMNRNYSFNIDTLFNVPMIKQGEIEKIVFNNVYVNDEKTNIEIDF